MSATLTRNILADTLRSDRSELQRLLRMSERSLVSHGWVIVIRYREGSLSVLDIVTEGNRVVKVKTSSLSRCARLTREDAETLCRDGNIRDGSGAIAEPMHLRDALQLQIENLSQLIASLES